MSRIRFAAFGALFLLMATVLSSMDSSGGEAVRITKEELKRRMDDATTVIIDVRGGRDWRESDRKISRAVREEPDNVSAWESRYPKATPLVLYCD